MITIELDDARVLDVLRSLLQRMTDMTPAMQDVGNYLVRSTKRRFGTSIGPDGQRWAPNSPITYLRMLEHSSGTTLKNGKINKKGATLVMGKKPLIGETHRLSTEIYPIVRRTSVSIGSPLKYAATQQFGAAQGEFGKTRRGGPIPWGRIPPRPFMGLDATDQANVIDIVREYLESPID